MRYKILDQHGLNFLTLTVVEWIDLFTRKAFADIVIESLRYCQKSKGLEIYAFVLMPSHMHLIVRAGSEDELSSILQSFKSFTASNIIAYLKDTTQPESRREWLLNHFEFNARKNKTNSQHQVWQRGNHPIILFSPHVIRQKLEYVHLNPVEAGIVAFAEHYLLCSASNYVTGKGILYVVVMDDLWNDIGYVQTAGI
ncbi:MAG: transposase [Bacteroidetes bacterium]|nr:transposase [Bacteroidota bacterium]